MASRYEVEVTVGSARDLKNVNWRNGDLKPYAVLWIDAGAKVSTRVDVDGGESPTWDDKLSVPLPPSSRLDDAVLYVDVVHANAGEGVKPLVGSARLPLRDVLDDAGGVGGRASRTLRLKRPSRRPQGKLDVRVAVKEPARYYDPNPYPAPAGAYAANRDPYAAGGAYGGAGGYGSGEYGSGGYGGGGYGSSGGYGAAQPYSAAPPPTGYPSPYGAAPPQPAAYGGGAYGAAPPVGAAVQDPNVATKKNSKMGVGTGVAVGAAAGLLGGLALAGGASYLENKFEENVAERVEDDLAREDSYGGGYDDYGGDDY